MPNTINPRTGLEESHHDFYNVPLVHQRNIGSLKFNGQMTAVHTVPIPGGLTLDFYARLGRCDELIVTFPGAATAQNNIYPLFARVATFRRLTPAFIAFADPTIMMDAEREMRLAWFLGGPDFDPAPYILRAIRKAQSKNGAKHVAFVGGSGGGIPALRLSAMVPGSMAYLHEGATNVARSIPASVGQYFQTVWPGWDQGQLLKAFPERFDMVRHYQRTQPENFVYFAQSQDDSRFRNDHFAPFRDAHGVKSESGVTPGGTRHFALYKGEVPGHGKVTAAEFENHFSRALEEWRGWRQHG